LRAQRRVATELSRPLASLDQLGRSQPLLANSEYGCRLLGYEYEYYVGKPVVRFQTDHAGFATITQRNREHRDVLAQSHLALQEFYLHLTNRGAHHAESFLKAGLALFRSLQRVPLDGRQALAVRGESQKNSFIENV
jgi:hypothetical protein